MMGEREERTALAGNLKEISFAEVVQFYSQNRRTAVLVVTAAQSGEELGYYYFERGELYDARLGQHEGIDAVHRGLELHEGTFHVVGDVRAHQRRIFKPVTAILLEGMRRLDEAGRSTAAPQLTLVRPPSGAESESESEEEEEEEDEMAKPEVMGLVCPTCRKLFIHGDVCPHDGARLEHAGAHPAGTTPAAGLMMPRPPRSGLSAMWWIVVGSSLAVIAAVTILWLTRIGALGSAAEPAQAAPSAASEPARVQQPASQAQAGAVRGVSEGEIVFGMAAPLSGATKELGRQMKLGVEASFHETNQAGGVHGRKLRLVAIDDGYEPTRTATAMKDLYEKEQVFGIVGNVGTPTAAVAIPFALEQKMLFYGAFTGANLLRRDPPDRYVVNFRASYAEETAAVVDYLVKVRRVQPNQIAVFAQRDSYGDAGFAGVTKAMRKLRSDRGSTLRVGYTRNTIDVTEAVTQIVEHPIAIRAVVMVGTYRACAKFIEKMRDINPKLIFTNVSFVGSTALAEELKLLGPRYTEGVIVTQVVPPVESHATAILKYKAALEKHAPGETPDYVSLEGYLAAQVLVEALQRAGRDLDTEHLVDTFELIRDLDLGVGAPISFSLTEHQGSHKVWGTQLDAAGRFEALDLE